MERPEASRGIAGRPRYLPLPLTPSQPPTARMPRGAPRGMERHSEDPGSASEHGERSHARRNHFWACELQTRLDLAEGKSPKGKGKGKGKGAKGSGAPEHRLTPRPWEEMTRADRWYLTQLWEGNLKRDKEEAESHCNAVAAGPFRVLDDED